MKEKLKVRLEKLLSTASIFKNIKSKSPFRLIKNFFLVKDGEKEVLNVKRTILVSGLFICLGACIGVFAGGGDDNSVLVKTSKPLAADAIEEGKASEPSTSGNVGKMLATSEAIKSESKTPTGPRSGTKINYKAQQVFLSDSPDVSKSIPMGSSFIGKTLTTIDTRQPEQTVKVFLPYGANSKTGGDLPSNTILFGQVTYGGKGEKVFVRFTKGILPNGEEFAVEAQALNPKDYSPGIVGAFHGNTDMRVASALGLTMVAEMGDVLTEKESIGGGGLQPSNVTVKPTMKNALYRGVSQVALSEANRQAQTIGDEQEYVMVDAGADIIISLTKAFYKN